METVEVRENLEGEGAGAVHGGGDFKRLEVKGILERRKDA